MQFQYNDKSQQLIDQVSAFMDEHIYPIEDEVFDFIHDPANLWVPAPQIEGLKAKAKAAGGIRRVQRGADQPRIRPGGRGYGPGHLGGRGV